MWSRFLFEETQFFILLLDRDRAEDVAWRAFCDRRLASAREARADLQKRFKNAGTLSREDAHRLKEIWIRALEEFNQAVAPSREETARALVIDFFGLG